MPAALRWFRIAAIGEACSWGLLLIGMFFKYVVVKNQVGVQVFGPVHGAMFVAYVVAVLAAARSQRWRIGQTVLGLLCSIPPFMTVWFERRVLRTQSRADVRVGA